MTSKARILPEAAVVFERILPGPIERVWDFLTKAELLPQWYGEDGRIEAREGGAVSLMGGHIRGTVTQCRPPHLLAYTWNVFNPAQSVSDYPESYLTFTLEQVDNAVKLTLTHRPIPEKMQPQTSMGWHTMLDLIEAGLHGETPKREDLFPKNAALYGVDIKNLKKRGDDMGDVAEVLDAQTIRFTRILPGPIERVWEYLYDGKKRGEWFCSGDTPSKPGETFEVRFKHSDLSPKQAMPPEKFKKMDETGHTGLCRLLEIEPPRRMVFEFDAKDPNSSVVEFLLTQEGDKVRFSLTHSTLHNANDAKNFSGGWHSHLEILRHKAEGRTPPAFWDVWREIEQTYDKRYAAA
jgi:uncharacterized protein YndB with AHSA1/START domain